MRKNNLWNEVIIEYLGKECVWCKSKTRLHIHHINPLSRGGSNTMGNLEVVCITCHIKLHKQIRNYLPKLKKAKPSICSLCDKFLTEINKVKTRKAMCKDCLSLSNKNRYKKRKLL